jgi:hypothetical protein
MFDLHLRAAVQPAQLVQRDLLVNCWVSIAPSAALAEYQHELKERIVLYFKYVHHIENFLSNASVRLLNHLHLPFRGGLARCGFPAAAFTSNVAE